MLPVLQIEDLSVSFSHVSPAVHVLEDISFDISPGEMIALVGKSGSGKSMTALAIMGLLPSGTVTSGKIFLQDCPANLLEANEKKWRALRGGKIAMIFQEPMTSLNPLMKCGNQIMESIKIHSKESNQDADKTCLLLLEKVGLRPADEIMNKYPHQLSGGQRQRIMIAMALAGSPALLIADEPTTALDPLVQHSILHLIRSLQHELKLAVLLITHDLGIAADFCDRIISIQKGKIDYMGAVSHFLDEARLTVAGKLPGEHNPKTTTLQSGQKDSKMIKVDPNDSANRILLRVENLTVSLSEKVKKGRSPVYVLDQISFSLEKNEILGLIGESGSGKSTLARILTGMITPDSGIVRFEEKSPEQFNHEELGKNRGKLQLIFQDPYGSLNPRLNVGETLREVLKVHEKQRDKQSAQEMAAALVNSVGLDSTFLNRYPHELSGGQRQRVCMARALACKPIFIVFDESLSALDKDMQEEILQLIRELQTKLQFSAIFISHDLDLVSSICKRVLVLQKGKIVEELKADRLFTDARHPYTQALAEAMPGKKFH